MPILIAEVSEIKNDSKQISCNFCRDLLFCSNGVIRVYVYIFIACHITDHTFFLSSAQIIVKALTY